MTPVEASKKMKMTVFFNLPDKRKKKQTKYKLNDDLLEQLILNEYLVKVIVQIGLIIYIK